MTISAILLCIGLFALRFPVFIDDYDQWGWQVNCGTGFTADLTQATAAVGDKNFVDQCETALIVRRLWTIRSSRSAPLHCWRCWPRRP